MLRRIALMVMAVTLVVAARLAEGQQAANAELGALAAQARAAGNSFRPLTDADIAAARAAVAAATNKLDAFLRTGAAYKATGWKRYLQWSDLTTLARGEAPPATEHITAIVGKLRAAHDGLELSVFTQLRQALEQYGSILAAAADKTAAAEFERRMQDLATQLEAFGQDLAAGDAAIAIGRTLRWLEANRQAPELVTAIRRVAGRPNFFGQASRRLAAAGVERHIDQITPVRDNILGTELHGTARMVGQTSLVLNENSEMASMHVLLSGTAWSNNTGYNGPVTIQSSGATSITGKKLVTMSAEGLEAFAAQAACRTSSTIHDICARLGLVERAAWRRAGQQQGQAEQIGSQHAASRVAGQMNAEVGQPVKEQNDRYQKKVRGPLLRRGEFPEDLTFSTTPERLQVRMRQESPGLLAAPNDAPALPHDHDLAARTHESAITNYAEGLLGGYYLTDLELERRMRDDLEVEVPAELQVTDDKEPWAIKFAAELPARAKFAGGKVWMAIRADAFYRGQDNRTAPYNRALAELIEISAEYTIEKTAQGATLRRSGDVVVSFPSARPGEQSIRRAGAAGFLRLKFRNLFKDEFVGQGLELKGQWEKAGKLALHEIQADKAWLVLGWDLPATAPPTAAAEPASAD